MISKIVYKELFGEFNYTINLNEEGITIITGPNGFGKSTILKSINAFYNFDIMFFWNLDFNEVQFHFDDIKTSVNIIKQNKGLLINGLSLDCASIENYILTKTVRRPYFRKIGQEKWVDIRNDEIVTQEELIESYNLNETLEESVSYINSYNKIKNIFDKYHSQTKFIKEQRLLREDNRGRFEHQTINVIEELPSKLINKMNEVSSNYSSEANKLDSSYPIRLFQTTTGISQDEYNECMKSMNLKFDKLKKYNISDIQKLENRNLFQEEHSKALKVYFDDFDEKYNVFSGFIDQLDLFTDIINSRLKFKEIKISKENGIEVFKSNNEKLKLNQLSSGEKQEIILFYELIFESGEEVHLLIDEPEISLHIEWQMSFMDDLLKISKKKKLKVTIATHSPQIINNHWDIQVDLGELYG